MVTGFRRILTRSGTYMATFSVEDPTGKINAIIFPKNFLQYGHLINEDDIIVERPPVHSHVDDSQLEKSFGITHGRLVV